MKKTADAPDVRFFILIFHLNKLWNLYPYLYVLKFKILLMGSYIILLNDLQNRNYSLKSKLIHEQLRHGTYHFGYSKKFLLVLSEYKKLHSFFKVSSVVDVSQKELIKWYVQGQLGDPKFRAFYLAIKDIGNAKDMEDQIHDDSQDDENALESIVHDEKDYIISQYGDGWSYKTFIDGEKIFLISNDLDNLKKKVKAKRLPLD